MPLYWLPVHPGFRGALSRIDQINDPVSRLRALHQLAQHDLDFVQLSNLDRRLRQVATTVTSSPPGFASLKLALLGSSTLDHLLAPLRASCLRRGVLLECYLPPFDQYRQELLNRSSGLFAFAPDVVLFALDCFANGPMPPLDAPIADADSIVRAIIDEWLEYWEIVQNQLKASVIHQTLVIQPQQIFGQMDVQVATTPRRVLNRVNEALCSQARERGVYILDVDHLASVVGRNEWCNMRLWFHGKQVISPAHAPLYCDYIARLIAALRGLARKCLVLDLDNTIWGGVVGDDGVEGLELGQGTGRGAAFQWFQRYAKSLKSRGVILAVCSKNDEPTALAAFDTHPEMVLRREDISVFCINWDDKALNLRRVAEQLRIGIDALVFVDDNPAERGLVRQVLPELAVPELPEDVAEYARTLSDAGYFEAVSFTAEDRHRSAQYLANANRQTLHVRSGDIDAFIRNLRMRMDVRPFDDIGRSRIAQLINKTNQFNLTTRRYTERQIQEIQADQTILTFQIRLHDAYGDNGMISVVIARPHTDGTARGLLIDTWLMSCRVLGRTVEREVLNILVDQARSHGYSYLQGEYMPTDRNGLVRDHYKQLGFRLVETGAHAPNGDTQWRLDLCSCSKQATHIESTYTPLDRDRHSS
jgi:FkbH-like protein